MLPGGSLVAQMVKRLPAMQESQVRFLAREDPLEKEMAIHSSTLAWKIPWREGPDRLQSMGSQRVRQNWVTNTNCSGLYRWIERFLSYTSLQAFRFAHTTALSPSVFTFWDAELHVFLCFINLGLCMFGFLFFWFGIDFWKDLTVLKS